MRKIDDMIADANRVAFLCDSEHRGCSCNHGDILAAARDTINELVNELKRMQDAACNNGDCERSRLGAEPCHGCRFCDEKGNI